MFCCPAELLSGNATYSLSTYSVHSLYPAMMKTLNQTFGLNVKRLRKIKGISQEDLALLSGLHRTYIGAVERGERNITLKNVEIIAACLSASVQELFQQD